MLPQEIIRKKRDGKALLRPGDRRVRRRHCPRRCVARARSRRSRMAVFFNGMSRDEAVALTLAMRDSGDVLDWSDLPGPVTDKHSTGGVGDNVSLMLAPIVAACGAYVPMISGRGLGHTGGTLDKMDAIPGYVSQPDNELFRKAVLETGCAIIGQTANLAPADKRFYGIRDVTATVESVPLITASILSKKLAAGLQSLVLDVKVGNGAFMERSRDAAALASSLVEVANGAGLRTTALLTGYERAAGLGRRQCGRGAKCRRLPDRRPQGSPASEGHIGARGRHALRSRHCGIASAGSGTGRGRAELGTRGGNLRAHGEGAGRSGRLHRRLPEISPGSAGAGACAIAARRFRHRHRYHETLAWRSSRSAAGEQGRRTPSITPSD